MDYDGETLDQVSEKLKITKKELAYLNDIPQDEIDKPLLPLKVFILIF